MAALLDEVSQTRLSAWNYCFGFVNTQVVQCAVELKIPDILEKNGSPMSLSQLSSLVGCPSSSIFRIMRFLTYHGVFKKIDFDVDQDVYYAQTPLSRLFTRDNMAPFMLLHGIPLNGSGGISAEALRTGKRPDLDVVDGSESTWNSDFLVHKKVFTDAMEFQARVATSAIIDNYPRGFEGVGSLVDVGGRHGLAVGMLVNAFPSIRGINFDLPQVVSDAPPRDRVVHVGGSMFESVPKADAVIIIRVLHDWSDEACVGILKKCKEAVPAETGKVMIVDAIIDKEGEGDDPYAAVRLALDMVMMAVTVKGKERTYEEWVSILDAAAFTKHKIIDIGAIEYVIEAYP